MNSLTVNDAREKLPSLHEKTAEANEPVLITGPHSNAVLIGEEEWNAIQETLYLVSIPGLRESIRGGLATPIEECEKEPGR
jgi:antitoxin YefM